MNDKHHLIAFGIVLFAAGILTSIIIFQLIPTVTGNVAKNYVPDETPGTIEDIVYACQNLDLEETSKCFRDNVRTFFRYDNDDEEVIFDDGIYKIENIDYDGDRLLGSITAPAAKRYPNFDFMNYLKENGGDCNQWTLFYTKLCEQIDFECNSAFNGAVLGIFNAHEYFVMSNQTHYCKIDQLNVDCKEI